MAAPIELTPRQRELLSYIEEIAGSEHRMPSYREMATALKLSAVGSIQDLVGALVEKGYLQKSGRHLSLSDRRQTAVVQIPIVGTVAAGQLQEAIQDNLGVMALSMDFVNLKKGRDVFALKVKGLSMIDAGILEGDLVVVQPQPEYKSGDTVVACYEGDATVKEVYFKGKGVTLHPRNPTMKDIVFDSRESEDLEILGKVVAVQRIMN